MSEELPKVSSRRKSAWRRHQPRNVREAIRMCKEFALAERRMGVARIVDAMVDGGCEVTEDALYKWLAKGNMPANVIRAYEVACGVEFVSEFLAGRAKKMVVDIPLNKRLDARDVNAWQKDFAAAVGLLIEYYERPSAERQELTMDALNEVLRGTAYHREQVAGYRQSELFGGE